MNFKRVGISVITAFSLVSSFALSYGEGNVTLNDYIEDANTNNIEIKLINEKLPREIKEYEKALQLSKAIDQKLLDETASDYDLNVLDQLSPLEKKKSLYDIKYKLMQTGNVVEKTASKYFYDYQISLQNFENSKDIFNTALRNYEAKKKEKELGLISDVDYMKLEQVYYNAYIAYLNSTNDFESLKKNINIYVSNSPSELINFEKVDIERVDTSFSIDVERDLKLALENSYQIKDLELQNEINEMNLKLKSRFSGFSDKVTEMNNHKDSIKENNLNIQNIKFELEYNINKLSNELKIAKNEYAIAELKYNMSKKEFNASIIKFNSGIISELDYIASEQAMVSSKLEYNSSRVNMLVKILEAKAYIEENTTLIK